MKVKDVMTADPLEYCRPKTKLRKVVKAMKKINCGALPVLSKKKVVGMITDRDIALALANKHNKQPAKLKAEDIMSSEVHSVSTNDEVSAALHEMRAHKVGRLPVIDKEGQLKGILSVHDLLAQSADGKEGSGNLSDSRENILQTVEALGEYYSGLYVPKKKKEEKKPVQKKQTLEYA